MDFYTIVKHPSGDELVEMYRTDFEYDDSVICVDAPRCPNCNSCVGLLEGTPPFKFHLETWGVGFGDLAFWMSDFLVTARFRDEFERSGLRGLSRFHSTTCLTIKNHRHQLGKPPAYFRTLPCIGGARVDPAASRMEWEDDGKPTCNVCLSGDIVRWEGVYIDESSWKGDDIFYPYGLTGTLIVSARFVEWASAYNYYNLVFKSGPESGHDFLPWAKST